MRKKIMIFSGICVFGLSIAGYVLTAEEALSKHPVYTITWNKAIIRPLVNETTEYQETRSFREDGSEAVTVGAAKNGRGEEEAPGGSYVLDRTKNEQTIVSPIAGGRMTFPLINRRGFRKYPSDCSGILVSTAKMTGTEVILGVSTVRYQVAFEPEPGVKVEDFYWYAPSLNCALVKEKMLWRDVNNQITRINLVDPSSISSEAAAEAFKAGDNYPEYSPAELQNQYVKKTGKTAAECQNNGVADLEAKHRKRTPLQ